MNEIFNVEGMTCGHCERAVTKAINRVDPQAQVSISRDQNRVQVDNAQVSRSVLAQAIAEEGYKVQP